ncbi:hypothetical protein HOD88_03210 [archaeon]|nr:hypothetical protein [archaeon]
MQDSAASAQTTAEFATTTLGKDLSGLTAGIITHPTGKWTARTGIVRDSEDLGLSAGSTYAPGNFKLDGSLWRVGGETEGNGFVRGTASLGNGLEGYLSVGGSTNKNEMNMVAGAFTDGGMGVYTFTHADLETGAKEGRLVVVPKGNGRLLSGLDFKTSMYNQTGMRGEFADNTIIGWAPYPAQMASPDKDGHVAFVTNWENSSTNVGADFGVFYLPDNKSLGGITLIGDHDKLTGETETTLRADLFQNFGPFQLAAIFKQNLKTGKTNPAVYLAKTIPFGQTE